MKTTILVTVLLGCASCSNLPQPRVRLLEDDDAAMTCGIVCVAPGRAATAGHCLGSPRAVEVLPDTSCWSIETRDAVTGEMVTIEGWAWGVKSSRRAAVVDPNWSGWLITTGTGRMGESGGGVYGADGALMGIVLETRDALTYSRRIATIGENP